MKNYFSEIEKMVNASAMDFDAIAVINKDGIVEYAKMLRQLPAKLDIAPFNKANVGQHILEVYSTLKEEESTVIRTLRTGEITTSPFQVLRAGARTVVISATTFPIFDEYGEIRGAVDAVKLLEYIDNTKQEHPAVGTALDSIIACNSEMLKIKETIIDVAKNDSPVFLYGETGTGKELVARALHQLGPRRKGLFISQNCAAIPANLLESTFFGTEKGGFTGAEPKQGLFELADGGTLFLDEVNSMDPIMQTKLLKALEEQRLRKIGGEKDICFNTRILCASNEHPADLIRKGRLREDFYYRVSVVMICLPPLRQRRDDIMLLTHHFIHVYNEKMGKSIQGITSMTEDLFLRWPWPGNVRELRSVIENAFNRETGNVITLDSVMDLLNRMESQEQVKDVPPAPVPPSQQKTLPSPEASQFFGYSQSAQNSRHSQRPQSHQSWQASDEIFQIPMIREKLCRGKIDLQKLLEDYERAVISQALRQSSSLTSAADKLSISPQKLNYRMHKLGLK